MAKKKGAHPTSDEDRIREEAHKLWEGEGRPDGRAERHWTEAREIIALKDSAGSALKPIDQPEDESAAAARTAAKQGDLPGMTDQGDEVKAPSFEAAREVADEMPLVTDAQEERAQEAVPGGTAPEEAKAPSPGTAASGRAGSKKAPEVDGAVGRDDESSPDADEKPAKSGKPAKAEKAKKSAKADKDTPKAKRKGA